MSLHQERRESCTHPNASARRFSQGYQVRINDSADHRAPRILDGFAIFINDEGEEKKEISLLDYYFYIQYLARFS